MRLFNNPISIYPLPLNRGKGKILVREVKPLLYNQFHPLLEKERVIKGVSLIENGAIINLSIVS